MPLNGLDTLLLVTHFGHRMLEPQSEVASTTGML